VVSDAGADGCGPGHALAGALGAAISRDGRNVYVASYDDGSVAVFARDQATGRLRQLAGLDGCVEQPDEDGQLPDACVPGAGLFHAAKIVVSPDGRNVYVLSGDALALFRRGAFGALAQLPGQAGCFSSDGSDGSCAASPLLEGGLGLAISPDGLNLYVASYVSGSIASFRRNPATGALTLLPGDGAGVDSDGVSDAVVSPDGGHVYAVSPFHDAVLAFARRPGGALGQLPGQAACVSDLQTGDTCAHGDVLTRASALAVSRDGRNVYVTSVEPVGGGCACGQELGSLSVFTRHQPLTLSLATPRPGELGVHAGRSFSITSRVRTNAGSVSVSCMAMAGMRRIHTSLSYSSGTARCSGTLPKGSAGTRLTGTFTATANGTAKWTTFSFPISG